MTADQLRKSILQQAIQGKLVPQDPKDKTASVLLERIREEKARLIKEKKAKREKNPSRIFRGEDNSYYEEFTATGEVRCIDDEIPFDLPDGWVWARLGEIAVSMADGPFGSNLKVEHYTHDPEVRIIQLSNIGEYGWRDSNKRYTTYEHLLSIERSVVDPGDIVIAKMMPAGRAIICPDMDNKYVLSSDAVKLKPASGLDVNFLLFAINSEIFRGQVYSDVQGITRVRTSISKLKGYLVPLPPFAEQERIVAKIEELMPWVEQYGKAQSELDQLNNSIQGRLRKSVLQYAIEGKLVPQQAEDGSAEELLAEIQAEKQRLYAAGKLKKKDLAHSTIFRAEDGKYYEQVGKTITCIDEEIPFDLPDGWVWTRLGEIAVSMADGPFGSNLKVEHYTHDPEVRIIQLSNIGEYGWRDSNKRYTTYEHLLSIERSVVDPGDIVIAKMMPAGRAIICPDMDNKYVLSSDAVKLKPASGLDVNFLLFAINSEIFRGQVYSDVQGITRVRTSISKLKGYLVPLPPLAEQQRIVTKLEEVFGVMDRLGQ